MHACGCGTDWTQMNALVNTTPPGNDGYIGEFTNVYQFTCYAGFFYDHPEILPNIAAVGVYRFDSDDAAVCVCARSVSLLITD